MVSQQCFSSDRKNYIPLVNELGLMYQVRRRMVARKGKRTTRRRGGGGGGGEEAFVSELQEFNEVAGHGRLSQPAVNGVSS
eukprot:762872-Hanusia_phi.AAC.5